jgi:hypothetical protein
MRANLFFHNRSFHSHEERQEIPLVDKLTALANEQAEAIHAHYIAVLDDTVNYGQSWSPAQHCRSRP